MHQYIIREIPFNTIKDKKLARKWPERLKESNKLIKTH